MRERLADGKREITLKFRHPDRYLASDRDVRAARPKRAETKLEEDIKPTFGSTPFTSLFSLSITQRVRNLERLDTVKDASRLFLNLRPLLSGRVRGRDALALVGFAPKRSF
jgi:hypothetical protein